MANRCGKKIETVTDFNFLGSKVTVDCDYSHEIKRHLLLGRKGMRNLDRVLKKQRHHFAGKGLSSKTMVFTVVLYGCEFWTIERPSTKELMLLVLEKILESPLDSKEIQPISRKGNQPWIFTGWTDADTEAPILWPPDAKSQLIGKAPDAGKDWGQEQKGVTMDEMVGWHHQLNEHEFEQTLGDSVEQGSLVCCSPWGHKESDTI